MMTWNFTNGWSLKIARVNHVMLMSAVMIASVQPVQAQQANEQETPSIELLEFLGGGVTVNDEYLDPINYSDIDADSEQVTKKKVVNGKTDKDEQ